MNDITSSALKQIIPAELISGDIETIKTDNPLIESKINSGCVVKPKDGEMLQNLIKKANEAKLNLTVSSSTGKHSRGGIAALTDHIHIDLSHWNKILWVNRRNRVCQIQPGVTYGELITELKKHGMTVSMPLAPRNGKSVIAAVMDREPSTWPNKQWDTSDPVASTEFIFGNGELFRTGAAGGPGSLEQQRAIGGAQKNPLGPSQTDFHRVVQGSQGTMGIVTWITMRTELLPSVQKTFLISADKIDRLIPFIYEVQRPWLGEHSFIINRTTAALLISNADKKKSFESIRDSLPEYICIQNIAGFKRLARSRAKYQYLDINDIAVKHNLKMQKSIGKVCAKKLLKISTSPCGEIDWRHTQKGNSLSIFFLTTLDRASDFINIIHKISDENKIDRKDVGVYVQPVVQNHACHIEFLIPYNPHNAEEIKNMQRIEKDAVNSLSKAGAFFSRPYGYAQDVVFRQNQINLETLKKVKDIFDPNKILNRDKWY